MVKLLRAVWNLKLLSLFFFHSNFGFIRTPPILKDLRKVRTSSRSMRSYLHDTITRAFRARPLFASHLVALFPLSLSRIILMPYCQTLSSAVLDAYSVSHTKPEVAGVPFQTRLCSCSKVFESWSGSEVFFQIWESDSRSNSENHRFNRNPAISALGQGHL